MPRNPDSPRPLRPILPASLRALATPSSQPGCSQAVGETVRSGKKKTVAACIACRKHRSKCNGHRPSCSACIKRDTACEYDTSSTDETPNQALKRKMGDLQEHADLLHMLQTAPEEDAFELLRRLRSTKNPSSVLSSIQGSMHSKKRPNQIRTDREMSPPTFSALEFELSARHKLVFPLLEPVDVTSISLSPLFSFIDNLRSSLPLQIESNIQDQALSTPDTDPQYCDDRLHQLQIDFWTTIPISNDLAASIISHYLELGHPLWAFFDAELFLDDLVNHQQNFCSSLLVSGLLSYGCMAYSAVDIRAAAYSKAFRREAESLWRASRSSDSVLNLAGIMVFSASCGSQVEGLSVKIPLLDGRHMAERMRLLGFQHDAITVAAFDNLSSEMKRCYAHVAWGAFNWIVFNAFYFRYSPPTFPPVFPIPGDIAVESQDLCPSWPLYPLPAYMGITSPALCRLYSIMQEVATVYITEDSAPIPFAFAEAKFQQLLHWADTLSRDLAREEHRPDQTIIFHILFHCAVLDIFQPFVQELNSRGLPSFTSADSSVQTAVRSSINQLKRLAVTCRLENPRTLSMALTLTASVHVGNAMIRDSPGFGDDGQQDLDWKAYFLLCLANCFDAYRCFPVSGMIGRGLLAMAMRDGGMSSGEAHALMQTLQARGKHHSPSIGTPILGEWILDFNSASAALGDVQARALVSRFEELVLFEELTGAGDYVQDVTET